LFSVFALGSGFLYGQAMLEHAAAAAGGAVGAAGGKPLATSVNKIFGKVGSVTSEAAKTDPKTKSPSEPLLKVGTSVPEPEKPAAARATISGGRAPKSTALSTDAFVGPVAASQPPASVPAPAPPPEPVRPTSEAIANLQAGASRDQVVNQLGAPSAKISMFEDGRLVEIYRFSNGGSTVGSVRLANGSVESVTPSRR
jgi:hypothetical protein